MDESDLTKELECVVCGSVLIDPRVLDCQHAFCLRCVFGIVRKERGRGISVECPFHCAERTVLDGDIRALKRNTLIANLCLAERARQLRQKEITLCDWCDEAVEDLQLCDRCGAVSCSACRDDPLCDHSFLCADAKRSNREPSALDVMPPLYCQTTAAALALRHITVGSSRPVVSRCELVFLRCPTVMAECSATANKQTVGAQFRVAAAPSSASPLGLRGLLAATRVSAASGLRPVELEVMYEAQIILEAVSKAHQHVAAVARSVKSAFKISPTPRARGECRAVAAHAEAFFSLAADCVLPLVLKLFLVGGLHGIRFTERLQKRARPDDTDALRQELVRYLRASIAVGGAVFAQYESCVDRVNVQRGAVADLLKSIDQVTVQPHAAATDDDSLLSSKLSSSLHTRVAHLTSLYSSLRAFYDDAFREVPSIAVGDEALLEYDQKAGAVERQLFAAAADRLRSTGIGATSVGLRRAPLSTTALRRAYAGLHNAPHYTTDMNQTAQLLRTLLPQIAGFRERHVELVERTPRQPEAHASLLQQLLALTTQALDLVLKDNLLRVLARLEQQQVAADKVQTALCDAVAVTLGVPGKDPVATLAMMSDAARGNSQQHLMASATRCAQVACGHSTPPPPTLATAVEGTSRVTASSLDRGLTAPVVGLSDPPDSSHFADHVRLQRLLRDAFQKDLGVAGCTFTTEPAPPVLRPVYIVTTEGSRRSLVVDAVTGGVSEALPVPTRFGLAVDRVLTTLRRPTTLLLSMSAWAGAGAVVALMTSV